MEWEGGESGRGLRSGFGLGKGEGELGKGLENGERELERWGRGRGKTGS